jgi:hypothetical protein
MEKSRNKIHVIHIIYIYEGDAAVVQPKTTSISLEKL